MDRHDSQEYKQAFRKEYEYPYWKLARRNLGNYLVCVAKDVLDDVRVLEVVRLFLVCGLRHVYHAMHNKNFSKNLGITFLAISLPCLSYCQVHCVLCEESISLCPGVGFQSDPNTAYPEDHPIVPTT